MENTQEKIEKILEIKAPGCASIRECNVRFIAIIGIRDRNNPKILRIVNAVRDYRGYEKKVKIYLSNDIIVIEHYRSNRGKVYISIIWKPESISEEEARRLAMRALGYYEEEVFL
jgi:hypothetical protein